ncbi:unnamed protein product [Camellia sinensis]
MFIADFSHHLYSRGLLTEGFFWIPSFEGPTTIAARQSGSGISWLIPFVDGEVLEEVYASNGSKPVPNYSRPRRSKPLKQKRAV